jgi:AcrR family transcriptional regulator
MTALRADARRNIERLLAEADAVFGEDGTDASLERVARQAGVAIGTLYRHFPHRRALIAALLRQRHTELFALGERLLGAGDPADALADWVRACTSHAATYRGLAGILAADTAEADELHAACTRMTRLTRRITKRARDAGSIRADATVGDIITLINAAAWTRAHGRADRLITLALAGLSQASAR